MNRTSILFAFVAVAMLIGVSAPLLGSAQAAELMTPQRHLARGATAATLRAEGSPFARSRRAQSVWASDACWNGCQSYCTWGEAACLKVDAQGRCLPDTDRCDRVCQSRCRLWGGPLVGLIE
jgi:hypothetical protein